MHGTTNRRILRICGRSSTSRIRRCWRPWGGKEWNVAHSAARFDRPGRFLENVECVRENGPSVWLLVGSRSSGFSCSTDVLCTQRRRCHCEEPTVSALSPMKDTLPVSRKTEQIARGFFGGGSLGLFNFLSERLTGDSGPTIFANQMSMAATIQFCSFSAEAHHRSICSDVPNGAHS